MVRLHVIDALESLTALRAPLATDDPNRNSLFWGEIAHRVLQCHFRIRNQEISTKDSNPLAKAPQIVRTLLNQAAEFDQCGVALILLLAEVRNSVCVKDLQEPLQLGVEIAVRVLLCH